MEKVINKRLIFKSRLFPTILLIAISGILFIQNGYADEEHSQQLTETIEAKQTTQTTCPVMVGNPIDKNIYTDYKGKRVYFCCNSCKAKFEKDPEKYLSNLPQFASVAESGHDYPSHEHSGGLFVLSRFIVPMGIITLSLVALTVALSIFRRLNVRLMMKWHKRMGIATLISGAAHAVLVFIAH